MSDREHITWNHIDQRQQVEVKLANGSRLTKKQPEDHFDDCSNDVSKGKKCELALDFLFL